MRIKNLSCHFKFALKCSFVLLFLFKEQSCHAANSMWSQTIAINNGSNTAASNNNLGTLTSLTITKAAFNAWSDNGLWWSGGSKFLYDVTGQDQGDLNYNNWDVPRSGGAGNDSYFGWDSNPNLNVFSALTYRGTYTLNYKFEARDNNGIFQSSAYAQTFTKASGDYYASNSSTTAIGQNAFNGGEATLTGAFKLDKFGTGQINLTGNNNYTGVTTINAGVLEAQHENALGSTAGGTTVNSGAALKLFNSTGISFASEALTLNGTGVSNSNGALRSVGGANTWNGAITLGSGVRINADTTGAAGSLTIAGNITGGSNVLFLGADGAAITLSGALSGGGASQDGTTTSIFKDGSGTLTLTGANTYSGDTRINQGTLTVGSGGNLGNGDSDVFISNGATLNVNADTTVDSIQETGNSNGGVIAIGTGATLTVDGANKGTKFQNSISGAGNLTVAGSGTTTIGLYGTQSYTGNTTVSGGKLSSDVALATAGVTVSGGTFETTADNVLSNSSKNVTVNSGTYDVKGSDSIGRLAGTGGTTAIASGKTLTANYGANASYGGTISGSGTFQKSGASTLTLASGASATVSTIAIQQGTLLLGAVNQIGDSTAITLSGGKLSTAGYQDVVGKLTVSAASTIQGMNSTSGSAFTFSDIDLTNYSTSSGSTLTFLNSSGTSYALGTIIQLSTVAASSWTGYGDGTSLNNFSSKISFSDANLRAQINFGGGTSGTTLTVAAIPEPKVYVAAGALALLIGMAEYRRRKKILSSKV